MKRCCAGRGGAGWGCADRRGGFTLVEVLIVVVVLGVLAASVVPHFASAAESTKISSAASTLRQVQQMLQVEFVAGGEYPATIEAEWFAGAALPVNPFDTTFEDSVYYDTADNAGKVHPTVKHIDSASLKTFWYNPLNGRFRARVAEQGTDAETLELYNVVNGSRLTDISQIVD